MVEEGYTTYYETTVSEETDLVESASAKILVGRRRGAFFLSQILGSKFRKIMRRFF